MNNKNPIIVLLVVLLLCTIGYIVYDKVVVQKDLNQEINDLKTQINSLNITNQIDKNDEKELCSKYIEAEFYGENSGGTGASRFEFKETLKLHKDGKFEDVYESSEPKEGTYFIENGKITLTYSQSMTNNANVSTYDITNNCSVINKNGDIKTLTRK